MKMMVKDESSMTSARNRTTGSECHGGTNVIILISLLRKRLELCEEEHISFRPAEQKGFSEVGLVV